MAKLEFEPVQDDDMKHYFRKIIVTCDECGNTTETNHFFEGEFLPISMFCMKCMAHRLAHARYAE